MAVLKSYCGNCFSCVWVPFVSLRFKFVHFFAHQLLHSFFSLHCLSCWLLHHQFNLFSLSPLPLLLSLFSLFSNASIINMCGASIFSRFVELFYLFFRLGCCFVQVKACLLYFAGMCIYLWSARLMVVSFLLCWTVWPASLFFHLLFNQSAKALLARSLYWKLFMLCFLPFYGCRICALDSHLYLFGQFMFFLFMAWLFNYGHSFICVYSVIKYITFSQ